MESYNKVGSKKMPWLLILLFIMSSYDNNIAQAKVTWSLKAAEEAEAVAAIDCSQHGRAFLDGILSDGSPKCECNTCYTGADCSQKIQGCSADVASGDGLFLEEYWKQHKENSAVLVSGWHRMSYFFNPVSNFISFELEKTIKELHEIVGNAAAKDKYIVFGVGVTQLIHGLVISLSPNMSATPCAPESKVVAHAPYYPVFREQTRYFDKKGYVWKGNAANYVNTSTPEQFIEMVTSPNNPEGLLRHEVIKGCKALAAAMSSPANPGPPNNSANPNNQIRPLEGERKTDGEGWIQFNYGEKGISQQIQVGTEVRCLVKRHRSVSQPRSEIPDQRISLGTMHSSILLINPCNVIKERVINHSGYV